MPWVKEVHNCVPPEPFWDDWSEYRQEIWKCPGCPQHYLVETGGMWTEIYYRGVLQDKKPAWSFHPVSTNFRRHHG